MCGTVADWKSKAEWVDIVVPHNGDSVKIEFYSSLDEDPINESWGIREFTLSVVTCEDNCQVLTEEFTDTSFTDSAV